MNEIPSSDSSNGNFAIEFITANAPFVSLPCNGFAPGPNGAPALLPSGVFPVAFPYTTFDVIVNIDNVCFAPLYAGLSVVADSLSAIKYAKESYKR